jgi:Amt family ammonium transporter
LSAAGVLILWLGWFGFNGGSVLSADPTNTSLVLVTTCLAAAAGGISAAFVSNLLYKNFRYNYVYEWSFRWSSWNYCWC